MQIHDLMSVMQTETIIWF